MAHSLIQEEEEQHSSKLSRQAFSFFVHTAIALAVWAGVMLVGYAINPSSVSQTAVLLLALGVPLIAGLLVNLFRQDEMAPLIWLLGLIWFMIVALWVVDMPTAPNQCFQCSLTEKLTRTFFSIPLPSGLIDDDGPFLGTWPAAALVGYAIGARLSLRKRDSE